jgi:hypothetical protein
MHLPSRLLQLLCLNADSSQEPKVLLKCIICAFAAPATSGQLQRACCCLLNESASNNVQFAGSSQHDGLPSETEERIDLSCKKGMLSAAGCEQNQQHEQCTGHVLHHHLSGLSNQRQKSEMAEVERAVCLINCA